MFYVIEIIEGRAGSLIGPKTWNECIDILKSFATQADQEDIKQGCYDDNAGYRVEIICCEED